jgi:hypothetical protein
LLNTNTTFCFVVFGCSNFVVVLVFKNMWAVARDGCKGVSCNARVDTRFTALAVYLSLKDVFSKRAYYTLLQVQQATAGDGLGEAPSGSPEGGEAQGRVSSSRPAPKPAPTAPLTASAAREMLEARGIVAPPAAAAEAAAASEAEAEGLADADADV